MQVSRFAAIAYAVRVVFDKNFNLLAQKIPSDTKLGLNLPRATRVTTASMGAKAGAAASAKAQRGCNSASQAARRMRRGGEAPAGWKNGIRAQ